MKSGRSMIRIMMRLTQTNMVHSQAKGYITSTSIASWCLIYHSLATTCRMLYQIGSSLNQIAFLHAIIFFPCLSFLVVISVVLAWHHTQNHIWSFFILFSIVYKVFTSQYVILFSKIVVFLKLNIWSCCNCESVIAINIINLWLIHHHADCFFLAIF